MTNCDASDNVYMSKLTLLIFFVVTLNMFDVLLTDNYQYQRQFFDTDNIN